MNLVWHIAKKDLRRFAWPVGLWCLFIFATALWFRFAGPSEVHSEADISTWLTLLRDFGWIVVGAQFVVGYVLVGALLIEDAPTGTDGFWLTRPMSGARLAGAKFTAAMLLFIVAPVLALTPVWLASGFGVGELVRAQGAFVWSHATLTVCALAVGALARDLAGFLARSVIVALAWVACQYVGARLSSAVTPLIEQSRMWVTVVAMTAVMLVVFVRQFVVRHNGRAWLTIVGGLIGCTGLRVVWPWDVVLSIEKPGTRVDDRSVQIEVSASFSTFGRNAREVPFLWVTTPWAKEGFYVPISVRALENSTVMELGSGWQKPALRVLDFEADKGRLKWQLFRNGTAEENSRLTGELELWFVHARVVGEMPVREGAELSDGSSRSRIVGLARENGRLDAIYLQENEFAMPAIGRVGKSGAIADGRYFEQFVLVDRAAHQSLALSVGGLQSVELNSQHLGFRRLFVPGEHDWSNGVLVRVVFERGQRFWRPIEVNGITDERVKP